MTIPHFAIFSSLRFFDEHFGRVVANQAGYGFGEVGQDFVGAAGRPARDLGPTPLRPVPVHHRQHHGVGTRAIVMARYRLDFTDAALDAHRVAIGNATFLGSFRIDFQEDLVVAALSGLHD